MVYINEKVKYYNRMQITIYLITKKTSETTLLYQFCSLLILVAEIPDKIIKNTHCAEISKLISNLPANKA